MKILRWILIPVLVLGLFFFSTMIQTKTEEERRTQVENAIQRALNLCYAQEGFYPAKLDYLIDNYGVQIDPESYFVYYKTIGANIRPDVSVYQRHPK
jgi:hypothetical protein